ncbi:MAG TPA: iron uptake transporter permease EfeU [Microbacterium sp.]|uniref:iron uptake transporter permease EfeU n=1 Tax=Microbacterium sp. TaxID=51671 RepID=UPI002B458F56|nr:iron uptake transporter permease EfeU [Microbacterium sp.]HKT55940.1 iron uptake transporter permease EfeU [Microbacterium sp.]
MLATFLIGLREGLEAALVVGILVAYITRVGRKDVLPRLWLGVVLAIVLALGIGAVLTFGEYAMTFQGQEILGGTMSLLTVGMVTWMIFWMQRSARTMKKSLEGGIDQALATGGLWALVIIGFVSVAREGVESALLLWSMTQSFGSSPFVLTGAVFGYGIAAVAGWLIAKGAVKLDLRRFFAWTGGFLVIVAAGVLAYAVHDLQEAGVLVGPFTSLAPVAHGGVAVGIAGFPFGWAFDLTGAIPPGSALATVLQATVGFMPQMSWLQVIAWVLFTGVVGSFFVRGLRRPARSPKPMPTTETAGSRPAATRATAPSVNGPVAAHVTGGAR